MSKISTTEKFIIKATKVHNSKYDYSQVEYINSILKVKIICPVHGIFEQQPAGHISGKGCKYCGYITNANNFASSRDEFIERASKKYNGFYDYSLVVYTRAIDKVKIICPIHGIFEQIPMSHLISKCPCKYCNKKISRARLVHTTEKFIEKAKNKHGELYDYSKVEYIDDVNKVNIICKIEGHGEFQQIASNHLKGYGCPICKSSKGELKVCKWLQEHNIIYVPQQKFKDCKNKRSLPFDFYLPDYNTCIEFDGIQHFIPQSFSRNKNDEYKFYKFDECKINDKIKDEYCINNNIRLIRIPYFDINNIDKILINSIS